ncbi:phosphomevalonate kinase [uncultured Corynebacterium sp.]|uniref:phosphomevalonate kinase n=1 Tax=uncultured Corynebacterium sp. TaxID=159447 RepID=UPI002606526B|nr:phosphomevalonate kinase [uncultured Corynebacterium sp.]
MSNAKGEPIESESIGRGCGKLYLTGEYAVMDVDGLAVIAGVDRYVTARCRDAEPSQSVSRVYSSYYGPQGRVIDVDAPDDIVTHAISLIYRIAADALDNLPRPLNILIESDLDDADSGAKYGLGSSGAVAVAVTRALGLHLGMELDSLQVYKIAMVATLLAGAAGSGGDIACSAHGGVVLYRRPDPTALAELVKVDAVAAVTAPWPNLRIDCRADLGGLQLLVGWTGSPVKTDSQLKKAGGADRDFVRGVSSISEKLWQALADADHAAAFACLRENRTLLQDYERERAVCIETEKLKALADIADAAGAAGKSSGSGGGDCGIALVGASNGGGAAGDAEEIAADIAARWRSAGIQSLPLKLAAQL